ncbi:SpoIIE family protein phosphatase [Streptomyces sp. NPDC087903]|uniref:SpoIIE family protein phosphatase n=1 Tax=Streptomyces sp. NPDC087903 TaxID=3365819 RepID=UPI0038140C9A
MLYVLLPDALWLLVMTGAPREMVIPWTRVGLSEQTPVADAVREDGLVWVAGMEDMAHRYPRTSLVLPYAFTLAAAPIRDSGVILGGLVLLWPGSHSPQLSDSERQAIDVGCRRLGRLLQHADEGDLRPPEEPRMLQPPSRGARHLPADAKELAAFIARLPGGACALDVNGRFTLVTPEAADLLGVDPAGLLGALAWEALPWMDVPEVEDRYRAAVVSEQPVAFTALRPPDSWLSFELYPDPSGISVRVAPTAPSDWLSPGGPLFPSAGREVAEPAAAGPGRASTLYHLMHLAATLTEAVGVQDVVAQAADQLMPALGASAMALMAVEDGRLRMLGHRGYSSTLMDRFDNLPLTTDTPAARVTANCAAQFFNSFEDLRLTYSDAVHMDDKASWAFLPLLASGRAIGSLVLAFDRPRHFPPAERAVLTSLAGLVGQAIERARLYDTQHAVARQLQAALLPRHLPTVPGLQVAARYRPADRGVEVGGDFYDLIRLDDTTVAAVIGDVEGHDIDAAALMGQVRTAMHGYATVEASLDDVLARTNRLLIDLDADRFASCLYVHLDLADQTAFLASAGHPPALLRHPDGRTEVLRPPPGLLLGIENQTHYLAIEFPMPPGCVLVLYTDGLIEQPGVDPDDATTTLATLVTHTDPSDLDAMADTLIRHSPEPHDDVALLLIRSTQTPNDQMGSVS